jgi:hypothetical protein
MNTISLQIEQIRSTTEFVHSTALAEIELGFDSPEGFANSFAALVEGAGGASGYASFAVTS